MMVSKLFPITGRRVTGRYDSGSFGGLLGFGIIIILACFH